MRERNLSIFVLQQIRIGALQNAGRSAMKARGMLAKFLAAAASFNADQADLSVGDEFEEGSNGIRSAANTGDDGGGQATLLLLNLLARLPTDDAMKVANHGRIRMRSE